MLLSPDKDAMLDTDEAKSAIAAMSGNATELKMDGSRASVFICMALFAKAIQLYVATHHNLPEFLISSNSIPFIPSRAVRSAKLFANRDDMLSLWPQGGVVCEVGTAYGDFAKEILTRTEPQKLHIVDIIMSRLDKDYFTPLVDKGRVQLHEGRSHDIIPHFPDDYFDAVYIDGDHWYDAVMGDATAMLPKVKEGGLIFFNDYTAWSPLEALPYGVLCVVNQLLQDENYEVAGFALTPGGISSAGGVVSPPGGYHDIAIRKLRN